MTHVKSPAQSFSIFFFSAEVGAFTNGSHFLACRGAVGGWLSRAIHPNKKGEKWWIEDQQMVKNGDFKHF